MALRRLGGPLGRLTRKGDAPLLAAHRWREFARDAAFPGPRSLAC